MATTVYFRNSINAPHSGTNLVKLDTSTSGWVRFDLSTFRGGGYVSDTGATVDGPTNGIEVDSGAGIPLEWVSSPVDGNVTISGTITLNLWAAEGAMTSNVAINAVIERLDSTGAILSTIATSTRTTELGTTIPPTAAQNFTVTPTSTNMVKGDMIRVRVFGDDAGTMAAGSPYTFYYEGTAGNLGESYVTFNETFGFLTTPPAGSKLYLTDTAGPAVGANIEKEMWTSRGDGVNTIVTNTVAGWTAPIQWTNSGGGTAVEWYSKQLVAFTLASLVTINLRGAESNIAANVSIRAELAVCNNDGSGATVWAAGNFNDANMGELGTAETSCNWILGGPDLAVTEGQRLRLRLYIDDISSAAMAASQTATLYYDGTAPAATGDSWIQLTQTVTEFSSTPDTPELYGRPYGRQGGLQTQSLLAQ